jgi:beta-lactam-binding protein with PASTA domain
VALSLLWPTWVRSQSITGTIVVGDDPAAVAINRVTNKIYVANAGAGRENGSVTIIDGTGNATTTILIGVRTCAVAVNELTNKIYVVHKGDTGPFGGGAPGGITVIDGVTNSLVTVADPNANGPVAVAVNPSTNKIYVANYWSGNVTVLDGATNATTTVTDPNTRGLGAAALVVNPETNRIYIANVSLNANTALTGNVTVIDGATDSTSTVTDPNAVHPNALAVNTATNKIYVANSSGNRGANGNVTVIDGATNSTVTVTDPNALYPYAVAVNATTNRIYVANANDPKSTGKGTVTVIDGATNSATTIRDPNALYPFAVAVNEATNTIYVANAGCRGDFCWEPGGNPGSITAIAGATNAVTTIIDPNANGPAAVAVDSATNLIYVPNIFTGNLTVINGSDRPTAHTLAVVLAGTGGGTVSSRPSGITCGCACELSVAPGTVVSLSAVADSWSGFAGWGGPCSGTGSCNVVANTDQFVTAIFHSGASMQVQVPDVTGQTQTAASSAIVGAGLVVGTVTFESSGTVASGEVIFECPPATKLVSSGSAVNLVVSTGAAQTSVPDVIDQIQAAASTAIGGAGLVVGTVTRQSSNTMTSGYVIGESPAPGTNVSSGTAVNLIVSTGAVRVTVPNVIGQTQAAASTAITAAGLLVGAMKYQSSGTEASGHVISESPAAGTRVSGDTAVSLIVSSGAPSVTVPNLIGLTQAAASTAITGAGLVVGSVTQQSSITVASGHVISASPAAGTNVATDAAVNLVISSGSTTDGGSSGNGGGGGIDPRTLGALLGVLIATVRGRRQRPLRARTGRRTFGP